MKKVISVFLLGMIPVIGFADEDKTKALPSDENEVRVSRGLRFSVPKDWPMDERNGGISPVPVEEYMLMKFKKIDERLAALENKVAPKDLEVSQEETKKKTETIGNRLQSFEQKPATLKGEGTENEKASS